MSKPPMAEPDTDISFASTTTQTKEHKEKGYILLQTRKSKTGYVATRQGQDVGGLSLSDHLSDCAV